MTKLEELTDRRSTDQNELLWALLGDVSRQVQWVVNGEKTFMNSIDWKDVFSAALRKYQRVAIGIEGGVVFLGMHTSKMTKAEFSDLIELILSFGNEHGVKWNEQ
jgi:hypothetical protein